jgi:hypothetical protein
MLSRQQHVLIAVVVGLLLAVAALVSQSIVRGQHPLTLLRSVRHQASSVHPLLLHALVVVSFNWDVHKLAFLEEVSRQADAFLS